MTSEEKTTKYIVQRPFTWDDVDYVRGDVFEERGDHPRLPAMKRGRFILTEDMNSSPLTGASPRSGTDTDDTDIRGKVIADAMEAAHIPVN